jgi:hypothetical protein
MRHFLSLKENCIISKKVANPFLFRVSGLAVTVIMKCAVASISALEELMNMVYSNTLNRDRKGWRDNG